MNKELSEILSVRLNAINELTDKDKIQIKKLLIDFFAAAYAGYKQNRDFNNAVGGIIHTQGGIPESAVLFSESRLPAENAAFINSMYAHGAELDDGCRIAMGHVGVHVIPSVLALAEAEGKTQKEIMTAIAVGYEAYIRVSAAAQPGMVNRGFHSTGMAGGIACAAACAKLLGLHAERMEDAMSLASTMSGGLLTYSESRQMIKPINPARAAQTGVFAARLARSGVKGPSNFLEGPNGWFHAVTDSVDEQMIIKDFDHLLMHDCYFKLYPSCRHTHCGIDAAVRLSEEIDVKEIQRVNVNIYPNAIKLAGQIIFPQNMDETKFSISYTVAVALIYGEYGVEYMNPSKMPPEVNKLIQKIQLVPDSHMENREKGIRGTSIEVEMSGNRTKSSTVLVPKGDPENPLSDMDLEKKLRMCVQNLMGDDSREWLMKNIAGFGGDDLFSLQMFLGEKAICRGKAK